MSASFVYAKDISAGSKDYVARIGAGIHDTDALFAQIGAQLRFPHWVHPNWDALEEWMTDLSWIPNRRIFLVHAATPHLTRRDLGLYLRILLYAIEVAETKGRVLVVAFPEQTRALKDAL